jgi:hypothetical protein
MCLTWRRFWRSGQSSLAVKWSSLSGKVCTLFRDTAVSPGSLLIKSMNSIDTENKKYEVEWRAIA